MSRITGSCSNQGEILAWTKVYREQIEKHLAWHENITPIQAESLLKGKELFIYLLWKGEENNAYYISFVKEDQTIKHQRFTLEFDFMGWYYKNGMNGSGYPTEIISETLTDLIPQMMHCNIKDCKMLAPY